MTYDVYYKTEVVTDDASFPKLIITYLILSTKILPGLKLPTTKTKAVKQVIHSIKISIYLDVTTRT